MNTISERDIDRGLASILGHTVAWKEQIDTMTREKRAVIEDVRSSGPGQSLASLIRSVRDAVEKLADAVREKIADRSLGNGEGTVEEDVMPRFPGPNLA